ncbi:MAG: serine hydrolase [Dehalococcoidia bacterium]
MRASHRVVRIVLTAALAACSLTAVWRTSASSALIAVPSASVPTQVAPADDLLALRDRMAQAIEDYWVPGQYAVAVTDLQTGESISVNGDRPQLSGCVVNLFALVQALRDVWTARYPIEDVDGLIAATIWSSNAITARDLYGIIGGGDVVSGVQRVARLISEDLALTAVVLDHPPAFDDSIGASPDNWVTADAMNAALADLWHGEAIPERSWRDVLLYHMTQVKPGLNYLTAVVPEVVSHKNGFMWTPYGYVDNDVAIVRLQRGDAEYAYAISFLSEGVEDEYADIPLGQQLVFLAYEAMSARYS